MKQTKKALLVSVLSVMLCAAMLVGGTFAWFTDSATTDVNKIVSGDLDVALYMKDGDTWVNAEGKTLSFTNVENSADILWEPGATFKLPELKVVNEGSLALKYQMMVNGVVGDMDLAKVLDVYVGGTKVGTLEKFMIDAFTTGVLNTKNAESDAIAITVKMQETAGNEYQNKTLAGMSVVVMASQNTYEKDMTDETYDAKAGTVQEQNVIDLEAAGYAVVADEAELVAALADGKNVVLNGNVAVTDGADIAAADDVVLDLNGYAISYASAETTANAAITNKGTLTINDAVGTGKITYSSSAPSAAYAYSTNTINNSGTLIVNGGLIENTTVGGSSNAIDNYVGATLTVNGGRIVSKNITVRLFANSTTTPVVATFNGGTITGLRGVQVHIATDGAKATLDINGGTFIGSAYSVLTIRGSGSFTDFDEIVVDIDNATLSGATYFLAGVAGVRNI